MHRGYVKLWRKSLDSGFINNPHLVQFWFWCLLKATYKPVSVTVGFQKIDLLPGQFIFGRKQAAEELGVGEQTIRTAVDSMRKRENLTIKVTNKFSIVSITNWSTYQSEENVSNHQTNQQLTSNQPATNHKQEVKEVKEETTTLSEKNPRTVKKVTYSETFNVWWGLYPRKESKAKAWEAWQRADLPSLSVLEAAIWWQRRSPQWTKDDGQFIPLPASYLNGRKWEDQPTEKLIPEVAPYVPKLAL